jgi:hypothetical protein
VDALVTAITTGFRDFENEKSHHMDDLDRLRLERCSDHPARRSTSAEFLLPNAMQLHTACSIAARRPACGT